MNGRCVEGHRERLPVSFTPAFRRLALALAYTGVRPGELLALRWCDVDFARGRVRVTSGKSPARVVPLPRSLTDDVVRLRGENEALIFSRWMVGALRPQLRTARSLRQVGLRRPAYVIVLYPAG
jgi:integrase